MSAAPPERLGATALADGRATFLVWAPRVERIDVRLEGPGQRIVRMKRDERGYHRAVAERVPPGSLYVLALDGGAGRPDPASRSQPRGVHGPSEVVAPDFPWTDGDWRGPALEDYVTYELHVGTFSAPGTFAGVIEQLDHLVDLGVTAVELMPVAQFPGSRNWGYDGVQPFAVQASYGGPPGLRRLVDACHGRGLAVVLDVVYNHVGPEGNYLAEFAPYFTDSYRTPWGPAVNFDGPDSDEVRRYFLDNALEWLVDYHVDALRIDAVHAIVDHSAKPFLEELSEAVDRRAEELGRRMYLIAESSLNDTRVIRPRAEGGLGLHAQWSDDLHHALHTLLTGERDGYYEDFGSLAQLGDALAEGFVYHGQVSAFRRRRHGNSSRDIPAQRFVVAAQTHDQVGNRMLGERLSTLAGLERAKLAAGAVLLSPYLPLLFMGEEYAESAPFLYFVSHSDEPLVEAVRGGRRDEFAPFAWKGEPPDPQDEATFLRSKLDLGLRADDPHRGILAFYRELIRLRRSRPALAVPDKRGLDVSVHEEERVVWIRRRRGADDLLVALHPGAEMVRAVPPPGRWRRLLDSADARWAGPGAAASGSGEEPARIVLAPWSVSLFEAEASAAGVAR